MYSEEHTCTLQSLIQKLFPLYLKSKIALIAEVTLALQAPVCASSYLPSASGVTQLSQPFPTFGFTNP